MGCKDKQHFLIMKHVLANTWWRWALGVGCWALGGWALGAGRRALGAGRRARTCYIGVDS